MIYRGYRIDLGPAGTTITRGGKLTHQFVGEIPDRLAMTMIDWDIGNPLSEEAVLAMNNPPEYKSDGVQNDKG